MRGHSTAGRYCAAAACEQRNDDDGGRQWGRINTGYITLTRHRGDLTITAPGVYDGLDISGYVVIKAPNVTLRRCIVRGGQPITKGGNAVISINCKAAQGS